MVTTILDILSKCEAGFSGIGEVPFCLILEQVIIETLRRSEMGMMRLPKIKDD